MTAKDLAALTFRFFGVFVLCVAIGWLSLSIGLISTWRYLHTGALEILAQQFLAPIVMVTLAVVLFIFSNRFAERVVPKNLAAQKVVQLRAEDLQPVLFSFAGILVACQALSLVSQGLAEILKSSPINDSKAAAPSGWMLLPGLLQLAIGVALFLEAGALSSFWYRRHTRATEEQSKPWDP